MPLNRFSHYIGGESARRGPPGEGFSLTSKGDYDIKSKRLCNVGDPEDEKDAVNLKTVSRECLSLEELLTLRFRALIEERFDVHNKKVIEEVASAYGKLSPVLENLIDFEKNASPVLANLQNTIANIVTKQIQVLENDFQTSHSNMLVTVDENYADKKSVDALRHALTARIEALEKRSAAP